MKAAAISFLLCVLSTAVFSGDAPKAEAVLKSYEKDFVKMTAKPHRVNIGIYMLCRSVPEAELQKMSKEEYGPHFLTRVDVFVDNQGANELRKESKVLPVGTVIVKKKTKVRYGKSNGVDGVGGMIKRETGYDPENGDWEYFYSDENGKVTSGKMESCSTCHRKAAETDYVFGSWLKPALSKAAGKNNKQ